MKKINIYCGIMLMVIAGLLPGCSGKQLSVTETTEGSEEESRWQENCKRVAEAITKYKMVNRVRIEPKTYEEFQEKEELTVYLILEGTEVYEEKQQEEFREIIDKNLICKNIKFQISYSDEESDTEYVEDDRYVREVIYVNGNWYTNGGEGSDSLPEGYRKKGNITYSDEEKLPDKELLMIPDIGSAGSVYTSVDDGDIYIGWNFNGGAGNDDWDYYCRYVKEENPEIYAEEVVGALEYICMDGRELHSVSLSSISFSEEEKEKLRELGRVTHYNENEVVRKDGYASSAACLGAEVYSDEETGIYYVHLALRDFWGKLEEYK